MKKTALSIVIVASLSAGTVMAAEPFKDRGIDYAATVQTDQSLQRESVTAQANNFNDRGIDYVEVVPVGANTPPADVSIAITGFNDRNHVAFTDKRRSVSDTDSDTQIGYSN